MQMAWAVAAGVAGGYLAGSIPFGLLIAKARGVDLRHEGSCNIGATNVFRCVGKGWGILALLLDALKGFIPAWLFPALIQAGRCEFCEPVPGWAGLAFGLAAVAGHNWPVWLGFKGGKGVATSVGVLLGVAPAEMGIGLAVFAVVLAATRRVSVGSIAAALAVVASAWGFFACGRMGLLLALVLTVLGAVVVVRHRANIARLARGEEPPLWGPGTPQKAKRAERGGKGS